MPGIVLEAGDAAVNKTPSMPPLELNSLAGKVNIEQLYKQLNKLSFQKSLSNSVGKTVHNVYNADSH